jgi:integrase
LTPNTAHRYAELWKVHAAPMLRTIPVAKLQPVHLQELYASLAHKTNGRGGTLSPRSIHHVHRMLHRVLSWSERLGLIAGNVSRRVEPPRPNPSPARALTPDEAVAILGEAKSTRWYPFFVVALATGMRRGELAALEWNSVDLERRTVIVRQSIGTDRRGGFFVKPTKTGRERIVPLSQDAIDAFRSIHVRQAAEKLAAKVYTDRGLVFADKHGEQMKLDAPTKAFVAAARKHGVVGVTLHSCRHSVATWALADGSDVRSVAALLGHSAPSTTLNVYGHVIAGAQERAVALISGALSAAQARLAAHVKAQG